VIWLSSTLANTAKPANKAARQAIVTHLFHVYFSASGLLLVGLIVVFAVASPHRMGARAPFDGVSRTCQGGVEPSGGRARRGQR
jgi:hypothetical protein